MTKAKPPVDLTMQALDSDYVIRDIVWSRRHAHYNVAMLNTLARSASLLNRLEYQMLVYAISYLEKSDTKLPLLRFRIQDIIKDLKLGSTSHGRVYKTFRSLCGKIVDLRGEGFEVGIPWGEFVVKEASYIRFAFNKVLLSFLLPDENRGLFTKANRFYLLQFKNVYSLRLYLYLKSWRAWKREYNQMQRRYEEIGDWRKLFAVSDFFDEKEKYIRYQDFKTRVLDPAISEINELSDYYVCYNGRKGIDKRECSGIEFFYYEKKPKKIEHLGGVIKYDDLEEFIVYAQREQ